MNDDYPNITSLTKVDQTPPIWLMEVDGMCLTLTTSQLQQYKLFQHAALEQANRLYFPMAPKDWAFLVASALRNFIIVPATPTPDPPPTPAAPI